MDKDTPIGFKYVRPWGQGPVYVLLTVNEVALFRALLHGAKAEDPALRYHYEQFGGEVSLTSEGLYFTDQMLEKIHRA